MERKGTSYFCEYLKNTIYFTIKSKIFFFVISLIEVIDILSNLIDQATQLFYYNKQYIAEDRKLSRHFLKISPYHHFFKILSESSKVNEFITLNFYVLFFYLLLMIHFIVFYFSMPKNDFHIISNIKYNIYYKIVVNFYDFIFYRPLAIYGFDIFSREIMKLLLFIKEYNLIDYILLFIYVFFLIVIYIWHLEYIKRINIWTNFMSSNSSVSYYPFDIFFSCKYDIVLLTIKVIIAITKNYEFFRDNYIDYITLFNIFLILIIFYGYAAYLIYIYFFSHKALYIFDNFNNAMRTFNILIISQLVLLRIFFNVKNNYKIFYPFSAFFFIFDLYICFYCFSNFLFNQGIKCQNYLAVGYYIESNKINLNTFITQWVINHKAICIIKDCPICIELGNSENLTSKEENIEEKKNLTITKEDINKKTFGNQNKLEENNVNMICKIFTPYKFNLKLMALAQNSKNELDYEDSIRFDFLYLTGLFLSNTNIDFLLYSELCLLMYKYRNNKNIFISLRLVYNIIRKQGQNKIQNFELLKKNDDLRESLRNFIQDYENFIYFSSKSPENYLNMSIKFKDFKDTVHNIHTIFKKNLERNYQLIIMRYAYDTLLHKNLKNEQSFDFSIYSEFLTDRFEKDKIISIKYLTDKDIFSIIKCSRDFIEYEGSNLENIFPDYINKSAIETFQSQLKDINQNNSSQTYECVIKKLSHYEKEGFIESFRMDYFIYPTNNINEIFIFGKKYYYGYTDYILYEVKKESKSYIFSFTSRIYRHLGITPKVISVLKRIGVLIEVDKVFTQKEKDNNTIFVLKYSNYYPFLDNLLNYDVLMDLPDYSTIMEKKKEIQHFSKEEKEVTFIITLKEERKHNGELLNIYNIKEELKKNDKRKRHSSQFKENNEDSEILSYEASEKENEYNNQSMNIASVDMASSISTNSYKDPSQVAPSAKGKQNNKNDDRIKSLKTIKTFTLIILIFAFFLIILSGIFLILEIKEYMYFRNVFELFQTFKIFKRGVESSPLSILSNYKYINKINNINNEVLLSINIYEVYSDNLQKDFPNSMGKVPRINELIQKEIYVKYFSIIKSFNEYLTALFNIKNDAAERVQNLIAFSFALQKEKNLTLQMGFSNFISLCREYNNFMSNLLLENIYLKQNTSILNMKNINFNGLLYQIESQYDFEFSSIMKNMLLLIFTYPSIHIGLSESSYFMQQEFHTSKDFMQKLLIIFFILLAVLHIILIIICISFFIIYLKLLKINIYSTNKLFMDKKYIKFQAKRLELFKILNTLYSINPIALFDKIRNLEEDYKRKSNEVKKIKKNEFKNILYAENNINTPVDENKSRSSSLSKEKVPDLKNMIANNDENKKGKEKINNKEKQENNNLENNDEDDENSSLIMKNYTLSPSLFQKVIFNYKMILIYLFGIYFIYCIIFFIFVILGINRLTNAISYCEVNSQIDELVYDNINSLIYMYLTNSTSHYYNSLIYGNDTKDYLEIGINNLYSFIQQKEYIEYTHSNLFPPLNEITNINCDQPSYIQDEHFIEASNILNSNYDDYIKYLCEVFPVAKTSNDNNIIYEILYMTEGFYRNFETGSFEHIFNDYIKDPILCRCFTLLLTFNKIIRTYFNNSAFPTEVYSIFNYFSALIIAYLVMSVVFEIIFFVVLNVTILQKIKYSNELLLDFIDSLKF